MKFDFLQNKSSPLISSQLSWESSFLYSSLTFDINNADFIFSVGLFSPVKQATIIVKMYKKDNFLFFESDPHNRRPLKQVLSLNYPTVSLKVLEQPILGYRYQLKFKKNRNLITIYINQPQTWKVLLSKFVIWKNIETEFSLLESKSQISSNTSSGNSSSSSNMIWSTTISCQSTDLKYNAVFLNLASIKKSRKYFERVIDSMINVNHPNILGVHRLFTTSEELILIEEQSDGESIASYLGQRNPKEQIKETSYILEQIDTIHKFLISKKVPDWKMCSHNLSISKASGRLLFSMNGLLKLCPNPPKQHPQISRSGLTSLKSKISQKNHPPLTLQKDKRTKKESGSVNINYLLEIILDRIRSKNMLNRGTGEANNIEDFFSENGQILKKTTIQKLPDRTIHQMFKKSIQWTDKYNSIETGIQEDESNFEENYSLNFGDLKKSNFYVSNIQNSITHNVKIFKKNKTKKSLQ